MGSGRIVVAIVVFLLIVLTSILLGLKLPVFNAFFGGMGGETSTLTITKTESATLTVTETMLETVTETIVSTTTSLVPVEVETIIPIEWSVELPRNSTYVEIISIHAGFASDWSSVWLEAVLGDVKPSEREYKICVSVVVHNFQGITSATGQIETKLGVLEQGVEIPLKWYTKPGDAKSVTIRIYLFKI